MRYKIVIKIGCLSEYTHESIQEYTNAENKKLKNKFLEVLSNAEWEGIFDILDDYEIETFSNNNNKWVLEKQSA
jgi:hypothetical protein